MPNILTATSLSYVSFREAVTFFCDRRLRRTFVLPLSFLTCQPEPESRLRFGVEGSAFALLQIIPVVCFHTRLTPKAQFISPGAASLRAVFRILARRVREATQTCGTLGDCLCRRPAPLFMRHSERAQESLFVCRARRASPSLVIASGTRRRSSLRRS